MLPPLEKVFNSILESGKNLEFVDNDIIIKKGDPNETKKKITEVSA